MSVLPLVSSSPCRTERPSSVFRLAGFLAEAVVRNDLAVTS
jgi:hypothetical protein